MAKYEAGGLSVPQLEAITRYVQESIRDNRPQDPTFRARIVSADSNIGVFDDVSGYGGAWQAGQLTAGVDGFLRYFAGAEGSYLDFEYARMAFIGDSHAALAQSTNQAVIGNSTDLSVANSFLDFGVGGTHSREHRDQLKDFEEVWAGGYPEFVFLSTGTNDVWRGIAPEETKVNIRYLCKRLNELGCIVLLLNDTPISDSYLAGLGASGVDRAYWAKHQKEIADFSRSIADDYGHYYVSINDWMGINNPASEFYYQYAHAGTTTDGIHMDGFGYIGLLQAFKYEGAPLWIESIDVHHVNEAGSGVGVVTEWTLEGDSPGDEWTYDTSVSSGGAGAGSLYDRLIFPPYRTAADAVPAIGPIKVHAADRLGLRLIMSGVAGGANGIVTGLSLNYSSQGKKGFEPTAVAP